MLKCNTTVFPYIRVDLSYLDGNVANVSDEEYRILLGREIPDGRWSGELGINDALCQM